MKVLMEISPAIDLEITNPLSAETTWLCAQADLQRFLYTSEVSCSHLLNSSCCASLTTPQAQHHSLFQTILTQPRWKYHIPFGRIDLSIANTQQYM
jgi:hypothetical protein